MTHNDLQLMTYSELAGKASYYLRIIRKLPAPILIFCGIALASLLLRMLILATIAILIAGTILAVYRILIYKLDAVIVRMKQIYHY